MQQQFLCDNHSNELNNKPLKAINICKFSFETAENYMDQGLWQEAIPHMGAAFEAAEILMTKEIDLANAYQAFADTSIFLAKAFTQLKRIKNSSNILKLAIYRLQQDLETSAQAEIKQIICQHLDALYTHLEVST